LLRKKQLLYQVALITFEQGDYFFEKDQIQHLIANYMGTFPEINTDLEQLQLDSEAVLKAIEVQHGLLLERARGIYSFSHLTFQEYFAAKQIVNISDLESLKKIVSHITNRRWRDVFLLASGISRNGDDLLRLIKQHIDRLMASDEKLQQFLIWLHQKSSSISISCKALAVRAFYLVRSHRTLTIGSIYTSNLTRSLAFVINLNDNLALDHDLACTLNCALTCTFYLGLTPERILDRVLALDHAFALAIALDYAIEHACNLELRCEAELSSSSLNKSLQQLKDRLPSIDKNEEEFKQWWEVNGQTWTEELRNTMISYRNIGRDWQFSYQQRKMLWQYFYANQLLVDCLSNCCYITPGIRQELEDTLLLPIAEIEKKQSIASRTST
jgi:predicted NACHT family NTPase